MRRRALIAGCGVALLATAGCALHRPRDQPDAFASHSPQARQLSQSAQSAIDRHDYERARADLMNLVAETPRSAEAYQQLGRVLQLEERLDEAEAAYQHALKLDPEYVGALIGLGQVEAELGRPEAALQRFEEAIEIDPNQSEAHYAHGRVCEAIGRTDEALAAYFRGLELDPGSAKMSVRVAALQLARKQADQALARLDELLDSVPDDPEAHHQRGLAHAVLKHPALAVADLQFAAKRLPQRADILYHLALALEANHRRTDAIDVADRALKLAPENAEARALTTRLRR